MKNKLKLCLFFSLALFSCRNEGFQVKSLNNISSGSITHPNHIIFLWLENKGFDSIIGNPNAPYINSLIQQGTLFTNSHAITHPSQPNYIAFFSGSTQGVTNDKCQVNTWTDQNLYTKLNKAGSTFAWYSEDLPEEGSEICASDNYKRKHNPTPNFENVPAEANKPFSLFPNDYNLLENVVCVSPNTLNDMHDGTVAEGDAWIQSNLGDLVDWCKSNNSIFVIYFDESDDKNDDNIIPVIAVGEHVKVNYQSNNYYDHYSWCKTTCSMFNANASWTDELDSASIMKDCWR